jgi:hypothetical protein
MPAVLESAAVNDCYQIRLIGTQEGVQTNNVLHFLTRSGDVDVETHLVAVMVQCFITNILPSLSNDWSLIEARWKKVSPTLGVEHVFVPTGTLTGGSVTNAFPSYVSALTSIRTLVGGRSHRGRMFLAGIPKDASFESQIDTAGSFWTAMLAWLACIATNFIHTGSPGTNEWSMAVYSRKIGGSTLPFGGPGFTAVSELVASPLLATTRSRKVGRGS